MAKVSRQNFVTKPSRVKARNRQRMKKQRHRKDRFTKVVGKSWVGRWNDGSLGWGIGPTISNWGTSMLSPDECPWFYDTRFKPWDNSKAKRDKVFLCRVTVEQIFDKNGRPITRNKKSILIID